MIAVVIPYFQREEGILARALRSVFASRGIDDVEIILVDDQSPVPARKELANLGRKRFPVTLIEQANAGPGGARNTGLDHLPAGTRYVAFLDSDDEWSPQHLENALTALGAGYDVYFADLLQLGAEVSAFRRAGQLDPSRHPTIPGRNDLHAYDGDMFNQIVTGNVIGTPTVVFDRQKYPNVRFRTDLTTAGEDYLFWLDLCLQGAAFAFGSATEVVCGRGVNVFAGSGWGTDGHARRVVDELAYRKALLASYPLADHQRQAVRTGLRSLRDALVKDYIHRASHGRSLDWSLLWSAMRREPRIAGRVFPVLTEMTIAGIQRCWQK